jgi:Spy/CpxP family protein refolding chaperone
MRYSTRFLKNITSVAVGALAIALAVPALAQDAAKAETKTEATADATPQCGPAGNHMLLEKFTKLLNLSCAQKDQLEPYLHDEESVSKPLLAFGAFTPEEKKDFMLKIKIAARNQIKPMLTPEQQTLLDGDIDSVSSNGGEKKKGGRKGAKKDDAEVKKDDGDAKKDAGEDKAEAKKGGSKKAKKPAKIAPPFEGEEALCQAVNKYSALSAEQKKEMILQVKKAARRDGAPELTPDQQKKIDADIQQLSAGTKAS